MMKRILTLLILLFPVTGLFAQHSSSERYLAQKNDSRHKKEINFNGQWKGGFDEDNGGIAGFTDDDIKYVLELTTEGSMVSGYSYTYFQGGDKKYYTICRLTGTINRTTRDIVVTEIERTKYNTPPDFENCFQTHRLHYEKDTGNIEILRGTWGPAPNQTRGCGSGTTVLSRRVVDPRPVGFLPNKKTGIAKAPVKRMPHTAAVPRPKTSHIRKVPVPKSPVEKTDKVEEAITQNEQILPKPGPDTHLAPPPEIKGFASRRKDIVKTISIEQSSFRLDFYDNGEIDGDSITVFYNGRVVLSHYRLSDKPISLTLTLDTDAKDNIVTMYADNLGSIPPNTALMVVTDGTKRYEVRMESDYGKSGSVLFTRNDP
jgi:hypothetical protein